MLFSEFEYFKRPQMRILVNNRFLFTRCLFSSSSAPRIALVGSGPAGLFTCASLLRKSNAIVDVFDASPVPFGLVRYGVAPDHQEVKNCIHGFDKMFENHRSRLSLFCNVRIGSDLKFEELTEHYDGVLLAYGSHRPRKLNIPGSSAKNVFSGSDFVSWYNGVPQAKGPILDTENVVIIGNGNVALDCARILSEGENKQLRGTDVPVEYLDVLERSRVKNIKIIGRRGPANISFTIKELREQFRVDGWNTSVTVSQDDLQQLKESLPALDRRRSRLMKVLLDGIRPPSGSRQCEFIFNHVPQEVLMDSEGRVSGVKLLHTKSNEIIDMPCGLLIYSIGYDIFVLSGVPKNDKGMIDMLDDCRVRMPNKDNKVYAVGWCAKGPKGVIVDTQIQAQIAADEMAKDLGQISARGSGGAKELLDKRKVRYISWDEWKQIDAEEMARGLEKGKVREKFTTFDKYTSRS